MTVYAWPGWGVEDFELHLVGNALEYPNPQSKDVQVLDQYGEYWAGSFSLPPGTDPAEGATRQAFFDRLMGRVHRVSMWDLKFPQPRGTARGSLVLAANAAQLAGSLSLSGALAAPNLLRGSDFELDANADGLGDSWIGYNTGNTGVVTRALTNATAVGSGYSQTVTCASMLGADTDRAGVTQIVSASGGIGTPVSASCYAWGDTGGGALQQVRVWVQLWLSGVAGQVVVDSGGITLTNAWTRYAASGVATQAFDEIRMYVWQQARPGGAGTAVLHVDKAQLELAAAPSAYAGHPTLLAGDMLGVGGQLFRVMADVELSDAGAGTVTVLPRLRQAVSSGAAVTWNKPTANFLVQADEVVTRWRGGATFEASRDIRIVEA